MPTAPTRKQLPCETLSRSSIHTVVAHGLDRTVKPAHPIPFINTYLHLLNAKCGEPAHLFTGYEAASSEGGSLRPSL